MFSLPQIVALAVDFPAASAIDLSPMTVCLALAALSLMDDDKLWRGDGDNLSAAELEVIHDILATALSEVMV